MIVNATPHPLHIYSADTPDVVHPGDGWEPIRVIPRAEAPARFTAETTADGDLDGIPVEVEVPGEITGLPDPQDGVTVVVSRGLVHHPDLAGRRDLVVVGRPVRDPEGHTVGCRGLLRLDIDDAPDLREIDIEAATITARTPDGPRTVRIERRVHTEQIHDVGDLMLLAGLPRQRVYWMVHGGSDATSAHSTPEALESAAGILAAGDGAPPEDDPMAAVQGRGGYYMWGRDVCIPVTVRDSRGLATEVPADEIATAVQRELDRQTQEH